MNPYKQRTMQHEVNVTQLPGADPGFSLGGGGRKDYCARTHITSAEPNSLAAGVQARLRALSSKVGSSKVVLMLSRAI